MKGLFGVNIVDLLQTGFVGFAVILMYLAYKLLQKLVETSDRPIEILNTQKDAITRFMYLSALVMAAGLSQTLIQQLFPPRAETVLLTLDTRPINFRHSDKLRLRINGEFLAWSQEDMGGGDKRILIRDTKVPSGTVDLDFGKIKDIISGLEAEVASLQQTLVSRNAAITPGASTERESGF